MPRSEKAATQLGGSYALITSETVETTNFAIAPQEVVLIAALEIPVRDSHGDYLLVISPRYENLHEGGPVETSHWAPPYVAGVLKPPRVGWKNIGQVQKALTSAKTGGIDGWTPGVALVEMISTWACGLYEVELVGEVTEYKRSWTTPSVMKVYHTLRYRVNDDANTCVRRALADPESRKGFSFLPLDEDRFESATRVRHCDRHGVDELMFIGKPMVTNLAAVVGAPQTRSWLREHAFEIARHDFYAEHEGLLVCGDIANYGGACKYASRHMHGMKIGDEDSDVVLRDLATVAITRIFHDAGLSQVHTAGDGFIAAVPALPEDADACLERFLAAYRTFMQVLDQISDQLARHYYESEETGTPPPSLGSRLAVHYGSYRYGKMAQAASLITGFDGAAVIDVARHEQGLRRITKNSELASSAGLADAVHSVVFSLNAAEVLGESEVASIDKTVTVPIESKETDEEGHVRPLP